MHIEQFYDLVSNKEKYEAQLKALKQAEEDARKAIELVGPAKDIQIMRAAARNDIEKVAKEVEQRRAEIAQEAAKSKVEIQKLWDEVNVKQKELAKQEQLIVKATEELADIRAEVLKSQQKAEQQLQSLTEKALGLKAKEQLLNDKLAQLKAIAG